jgi:Ca-activated chloride channel homolog
MDQLSKLLYSACALALVSCGDGSSDLPAGSRSVVQGGPQDIGEYRAIVAAGGVPALSVLEENGFFAEHKIDLPAADCGASICIHPMLAVAPRFDGGNWTMAFVGMNTAVDASTLPLEPRHIVLVLGNETQGVGDIAPILEAGLTPDDRVSVISSRGRETPEQGIRPGQLTGDLLVHRLSTPPLSLYSALTDALAVVRAPGFADYAGRVLLFPRSFYDSGLEPQHLADLALEFARQETPISVFQELGSGSEAALADLTSGNYYSTRNRTDLIQAVAVETQTGFVPLARNLELTLTAAPGYRIGRVYGAPNARVDGASAVLSSPVSYVGARDASSDTQTGRRGGGGGWFVQLLTDGPATGTPYSPADAFTLDVAYDDAVSGERVTGTHPLQTPLGVGQNPPPEQPYFSDAERGKPFMMLNMYLALATTTQLANQNECGAARAIEPMMRDAWQIFSQLFPDPDIDADFALLTELTRNIQQSCREPIPQIVDVPFGCGYL